MTDRREEEWQQISHNIPDPAVILMMDGSYTAWSMKDDIRCHRPTREEALQGLDQILTGAFV